jgi:hypothetical protein
MSSVLPPKADLRSARYSGPPRRAEDDRGLCAVVADTLRSGSAPRERVRIDVFDLAVVRGDARQKVGKLLGKAWIERPHVSFRRMRTLPCLPAAPPRRRGEQARPARMCPPRRSDNRPQAVRCCFKETPRPAHCSGRPGRSRYERPRHHARYAPLRQAARVTRLGSTTLTPSTACGGAEGERSTSSPSAMASAIRASSA